MSREGGRYDEAEEGDALEVTLHVEELARRPLSCPFCHAAIRASEPVWECPRCSTVHHEECVRDNHYCTIFGCETPYLRRRIGRHERPAPSSALAWLVTPLALMAGGLIFLGFVAAADSVHPAPRSRGRVVNAKQQAAQTQYLENQCAATLARALDAASSRDLRDLAFNDALVLYQQVATAGAGRAAVRAEIERRVRTLAGASGRSGDDVTALLDELDRGQRRR